MTLFPAFQPRAADFRVIVVGGGITGLACAYALRQRCPRASVLVLEAGQRLGGSIHTTHEAGFLLESGPDSFLKTKPHALDLCQKLGLAGELISPRPEARRVYLVHRGKLEPLPLGMVLGVPTRLTPFINSKLLSPWGKLRMLLELLQPQTTRTAEDESIAAFMQRHFGVEALAHIFAPLLGAIHSGNVADLSLRATFPQLLELEAKYGSVLLGLLAAQSRTARGSLAPLATWRALWRWVSGHTQPQPSPFMSLRRGLGSLIEALGESLGSGVCRVGVRVQHAELLPAGGGRLETEIGPLVADELVLATPAHVSARLLCSGPLAHELEKSSITRTASVFLGLRRDQVEHKLDASGFLVSQGQAQIQGSTWMSTKWPGRAPDGHVLLRVYIGGETATIDVRGLDDEALVHLARTELERLMRGALGTPVLTRVFRHYARPLPNIGHVARLQRLQSLEQATPGLYLAGAAFDGSGIPDCIRQGTEVAERIVRKRELT